MEDRGMIRPAKSTDAFALVDILLERHAETRYALDVPIDEPVARKLFAQAVQRHGGTTEGATFLMVHDDEHGAPDTFVLGVLSRVYMIGTRLAASDVFLIGRRDANPRALLKLFDAYLAWADGNPRVFEIGASWADTIAGNEGINDSYIRRGFELCGKTYCRASLNCPKDMTV